MRALEVDDPVEVMVRGEWVSARCASPGFTDNIFELAFGGSVILPRVEPKLWRFVAPVSKR